MSVAIVTGEPERHILDQGRRGRTIAWIMAIMLFLTVLAAALGLATVSAARGLDRQLAGQLTVQIVQADAAVRAREASAAATALPHVAGVVRVSPVDPATVTRLLQPWLGTDAADPGLPIPALIDVDLRGDTEAAAMRVRTALRPIVPDASVTPHAQWMAPVARLLATLIWLAAALVLLMAAATAAVVLLGARAGLDTHHDTIEVLHMLGSTDVQVARLFQRRIALDTFAGGVPGAALALAVVAYLGSRVGALDSALLSGATLTVADWLMLATLPLIFTLLATVAARTAVLRRLERIL